MAAAGDVIMLLWLLLKLIRCHVAILNWKFTGHLLHIPSFMSIGWILLKIERGGGAYNFVFFMPSLAIRLPPRIVNFRVNQKNLYTTSAPSILLTVSACFRACFTVIISANIQLIFWVPGSENESRARYSKWRICVNVNVFATECIQDVYS